jgi:hypothetical protein
MPSDPTTGRESPGLADARRIASKSTAAESAAPTTMACSAHLVPHIGMATKLTPRAPTIAPIVLAA